MVEDDPEAPAPAPVTTIAWRVWHIASSCLAGYVTHLGPWPLGVEGREWYPDAASACAAGPFADNTWADLVTHAADELSHHGAEIALLRDLYPTLGRISGVPAQRPRRLGVPPGNTDSWKS